MIIGNDLANQIMAEILCNNQVEDLDAEIYLKFADLWNDLSSEFRHKLIENVKNLEIKN